MQTISEDRVVFNTFIEKHEIEKFTKAILLLKYNKNADVNII